MAPRCEDTQDLLHRVVDALGEHSIVTLYGVPSAGKSTLAHAAIRALDCPTQRLVDVPDDRHSIGESPLILIDGADHLSATDLDRLAYLAATTPTRWLLTRRRRTGLDDECSLLVGTIEHAEAALLLERFLGRRGCAVSPADRWRIVTTVTPLPGVLFEAARLVEVYGAETVVARWPEFDPLPALLARELELLRPRERAALIAAGCFVGTFDALAFEAVGEDARALAELLDAGYVERDGTSEVPMFRMLPGLRLIAPQPSDDVATRHARWAAADGSRADLLDVAQRAATRADGSPELVAAVVRLCEGPLPPASLVDAALACAGEAEVTVLTCARSRIALRDGDPKEATRLAEVAAARATSDEAITAVHALRAQIARVVAAPEDALREYEEAIAHGDASEDILLEYAATLWESGHHDVARRATEEALERARSSGDVRREGVVSSNLGVMAHHSGELDEARALHQAALELHVEAGNRRFEGIAKFDLATLDHELGVLRSALDRYTAAAMILDEARDRRLADLARAAAETTRAQLGLPPVWPIESIEQGFEAVGDAMLTEAVALYRRVIRALQGACEPFDAAPFAGRPDELQLPARLLELVTTARTDGSLLEVSQEHDHFRLGGNLVDLGAREALRNTLALLVDARLETREPVSLDAVITHGWPGEVVTEDAAKNRAHVTLSTLRRLGLRDVLETVDGGYRLTAPVVLVQTSTGPTASSS